MAASPRSRFLKLSIGDAKDSALTLQSALARPRYLKLAPRSSLDSQWMRREQMQPMRVEGIGLRANGLLIGTLEVHFVDIAEGF